MMTPSWNSMWMLPMVWSWRAISLRGPATPSRPGTGTREVKRESITERESTQIIKVNEITSTYAL